MRFKQKMLKETQFFHVQKFTLIYCMYFISFSIYDDLKNFETFLSGQNFMRYLYLTAVPTEIYSGGLWIFQ